MSDIRIVCPKNFPDIVWNEVETLGVMTWLCLQDESRHHIEFHQIMNYLMCLLKLGQFVLFYEAHKPIGYVTWAHFNQQTEKEYLFKKAALFDNPEYWQSGNLFWGIQFFLLSVILGK